MNCKYVCCIIYYFYSIYSTSVFTAVLSVCSSGALLIFTTCFSCTCCTLSHTLFSCYFCSFFRVYSCPSWFCNLFCHFSLYCCRFMFLFLRWSHTFFLSIFLQWIFFSLLFYSSSSFFV